MTFFLQLFRHCLFSGVGCIDRCGMFEIGYSRTEPKEVPPAMAELRSLTGLAMVEQFLIAFGKTLGFGAGGADFLALEEFLALPEEYAYNFAILDEVMIALLGPLERKLKRDWTKPLRKALQDNRDYFEPTLYSRNGKNGHVLESRTFSEVSAHVPMVSMRSTDS